MSEYLSKEEIKQWRSSLEKITLEEFAERLGKKIEEKKETNDLVDIVLHGKPVISFDSDLSSKAERLSSIADKAYEKEKEIRFSPFSVKNLQNSGKNIKKSGKTVSAATQKTAEVKKEDKLTDKVKSVIKNDKESNTEKKSSKKVDVIFKKSLTDREQKVFDYFNSHIDEVVYAKDLALLLNLPRDYVYKYIKNLRAKIEGDALKNADKGGFVLSLD